MDGDGTFALILVLGTVGGFAFLGCLAGLAREYLAQWEGETPVGTSHPWARRVRARDMGAGATTSTATGRTTRAAPPWEASGAAEDAPRAWAELYGHGEEGGHGRELVGVGGRRAYGYVGGELVPLSGLAVLVPALPDKAWN
jgi:hypothetical protein